MQGVFSVVQVVQLGTYLGLEDPIGHQGWVKDSTMN